MKNIKWKSKHFSKFPSHKNKHEAGKKKPAKNVITWINIIQAVLDVNKEDIKIRIQEINWKYKIISDITIKLLETKGENI